MRMHEKWMCRPYNMTVFYSVIGAQRRRSPSALAIEVFESHLGSHILQVKKWLFQEKSKYLPSHISADNLNTIVDSTYIDEIFFFFNAHIFSILKVHNWESVNEREGKCYFSWITIFCCLELCDRCLLAECPYVFVWMCVQTSILCWWFVLCHVSV